MRCFQRLPDTAGPCSCWGSLHHQVGPSCPAANWHSSPHQLHAWPERWHVSCSSHHPPQEARRHCVAQSQSSRRDALLAVASAASFMFLPNSPALSSVELVAAADNSVMGRLSRAMLPFSFPFQATAPEPVKFPRKPLDQRFAVLLMRSGYDAVDMLDFIPRQKFEARFWKLRQSELEGYNLLFAPLKMRQGDLTDPLYFDFISFAQSSTISREMQRPQQVFEEYYEVCSGVSDDEPCASGTAVVRRPKQYQDDAQLPSYYFQVAGDLIYHGLSFGFRGEQFGGPPPAPPGTGIQQVAQGVQQLLDVMVDKGFALKTEVSEVQTGGSTAAAGGSFTVSVQGPCNLWALHALSARRSLVLNVYDAMVTSAWLRASGRQARFDVELTDSGLLEHWQVI